MAKFELPQAAASAEIPPQVSLQIVSHGAEPPLGDGWLHEIKHDGHRLLVIVTGQELRLVSRNGYDRTELFREPFRPLALAGLPPMVLDGEIAVPDERGVTHIDALSETISARRPEQFAFFAFHLLYLDGHDLRRCQIEDRKCAAARRDRRRPVPAHRPCRLRCRHRPGAVRGDAAARCRGHRVEAARRFVRLWSCPRDDRARLGLEDLLLRCFASIHRRRPKERP